MELGGRILAVRWWIVLACAVLLGLCAFGTSRLVVTVDPHDYFSEDDPRHLELLKLEDTYASELNVIFVLEPEGGTVFTPEVLGAIAWLTERGWELPHSRRVDSLTNYQLTAADGDDLLVEDLVPEPESLSQEEADRIRETAFQETPLINRIISETGHVSGVIVSLNKVEDALEAEMKIVNKARDLAAEFQERYPAIRMRLTGMIMWNAAFRETARKEIGTLVPIMVLVMAVLVFLSLRSVPAVLLVLTVILSSALTAMGLAGFMGIRLGDAVSAAPSIIMTLAVADSIHILTTLFQEMRSGRSQREALLESLRVNLQPVFLTSITTAVGFLSLNFSDSPPFHDLGNVVAIGVLAAFLYSVLLMPAIVALLPIRPRTASAFGPRSCDWVADLVLRRSRAIFWIMALLILGLAAGIPRIELDDNFIEYMDESVPFRRDTDFMYRELMGLDTLQYSLPAGEEGGVSAPEYLAGVEAFADWFRTDPRTRHISSINDIVKKMNQAMHGNDPAWYRVPDDRELAAQYLLLYEMSVPFGLDLTALVNIDKSASRFVVNLGDLTSMEMTEIERAADAWLRTNAPKLHAPTSGLSILFSHITENNIKAMLSGTFVALLIISGILLVALRSWRIGLISLIPNLIPAVMTFGLWGLTMTRVGLAASVVAAMTLGIVVDDTVHFLSKYLRARREHGLSAEEAVRFSFRSVGMAMFFTSVILIGGFLVLAFSSYRINMVMGTMSAIAIAFALIADFLFLPPLLLSLEGSTNAKADPAAAAAGAGIRPGRDA